MVTKTDVVNYDPPIGTDAKETVKVFLGKKRVGTIKPKGLGYAYFPTGGGKNHVGEEFRTIAAVKHSIEGEP